MKVSPLDLRQQRFRKSFRGFDPIEVASFLAAVADDYEQALRETDRVKQDLMRMEAVLTEHREHEKNLQATMTTAQKLSDDIKANAELEAQRIIREAEGRSELLVERAQARVEDMLGKAQTRVEDIQREIDGLKLKRKDVEISIEANISTLPTDDFPTTSTVDGVSIWTGRGWTEPSERMSVGLDSTQWGNRNTP